MTPDQFELHANIEDAHWWFVGRRHIVANIVATVVYDKPPMKLVDIGCGTGGNIGYFKQRFDCIGVDISEHAIDFAERRFPDINFICGGVGKKIYPIIEKADMLFLLDVLEHMENDSQFLQEITSHMKQGAMLLMTVPSDMSLWSPHDEFHGHFRRYSMNELLFKFKRLPVSIRLLSYYNTMLYPIIRFVRGFTSLTRQTWGQAHTDLSLPPKFLNSLLTKIFASESRWLINRMDRPHRETLPFGVSIISLLRKN
jgi:SAM-dependent methyltransferase